MLTPYLIVINNYTVQKGRQTFLISIYTSFRKQQPIFMFTLSSNPHKDSKLLFEIICDKMVLRMANINGI